MEYYNGDLKFDIEKIKRFDAEITIEPSFEPELDNEYGIDVEDTSYWYANEDERNSDYELLKNELTANNFRFVD